MAEWIRTKDRLPQEHEVVVGWTERGDYALSYWYTHSSGGKFWSVGGASGGPIKAPLYWCELPAPPQDGKP